MSEATAPMHAVAMADEGLGHGWRVVARKEFADHLRSIRFIVLAAILAIVTAATVVAAAGGIRSVASQAMGVPGIFLRLLTIESPPVPFPFIFVLMNFLGPFLGIAFGFDAISSEKSAGTLPRLLAQPIHRDEVIIGKFVAGLTIIGMMLIATTIFITGLGMFRLGLSPTAGEIGRLFVWVIVAIIYVGFWLALAILLSTRAGVATSILASLGLWLVLIFFGGFIFSGAANLLAPGDDEVAVAKAEILLSRISPAVLFSEASTVLLDPTQRTVDLVTVEQADRAILSNLTLSQSLSVVWPQVVGLVAISTVLFGLAFVSFMRQEIRA